MNFYRYGLRVERAGDFVAYPAADAYLWRRSVNAFGFSLSRGVIYISENWIAAKRRRINQPKVEDIDLEFF